eukprot:TRINITY_DN15213_c0_g1_i1.p2 TRINITY_DN15213_c0_g1~~TRINITY_DN15213_c0_g1_i1.p2  ORF type:complete len:115 (+),score=4.11 TRINITY_DN15213_c0_g1_i1:110-454(+)
MSLFDECVARPCGDGQGCIDDDPSKNGSFVCVCVDSAQRAVAQIADCTTGKEVAPWLVNCLIASGVLVFLSFAIVVQFAGKSCREVCSTQVRGDASTPTESVKMGDSSINPEIL